MNALYRSRTAIALALVTVAATVAAKQTPPPPAAPREVVLAEVRRFELPNGLRVRLVSYGEMPKAAVRLVTHTGNMDENAGETWLADVTAAMMEQGTATRSAEEIAEAMARMGGSLDVDVAVNQTTVGAEVFSESAANAIALLADVARHPRLPESELARVKGDLVRRVAIQRTQPDAMASEKFASLLFPNHRYGRLYPTDEELQSFTHEQVRAFHDRNFGAARSLVYVVGKFDAAAVEAAIRRALGDWKRGEPRTTVTVTPVARRAVHLVDRPGAVQSTIYIGLPLPDAAHPDRVPLAVMNSLLGGSFASRITTNLREQKGYTYSPHSTVHSRLGAGSWVQIADVTTNVTGASIREILAEIDRLRAEPPSEQELRAVQNLVAGTFILRSTSRTAIAAQLAFMDVYGLGDDYLREYISRVSAMTPADVQRIARTYLDPSKLAIVVVGDRTKIAAQLKAYE